MKEMFIAALLVMIVLIVLLFWVISRCVERLNKKVKSDFLGHLSVYDQQIEDKSRKMAELKRELRHMENLRQEPVEKQNCEQVEYMVLTDNHASYLDTDFKRDYAVVQTQFRQTAFEAMRDKVMQLIKERRDLNVHEYREIQQIFTQEMQYQMMTLPPEYEHEVISMIAQNSVGKKRILDSYSRQHPVFNFKEFMEYIEQYIYRHDSVVRVYSHTGEPCLEDAPRQVVFCEDSSIAEGYIVRYRDKVYDYSI